MKRIIAHKVARLILLVWCSVTLVFVGSRALPGDPAEQLLGINGADAAMLQALRRAHGLDRPLVGQYANYLWRLAHGDFGRSIRSGIPVTTEIASRLPVTLSLAGFALTLGCAFGILAGMTLVYYHRRWQESVGICVVALLNAIPLFVLGLFFLYGFSFGSSFLIAPDAGIRAVIIPGFVAALSVAAYVARLVRSGMLSAARSDSVLALHAYGVSRRSLWFRHLLKNASIPLLTIVGLLFGALLAGNILLENIFALPGMGRLLVEGVLMRDYPVIQGSVIVIATSYLMLNTVVETCYPLLDPRTRGDRR